MILQLFENDVFVMSVFFVSLSIVDSMDATDGHIWLGGFRTTKLALLDLLRVEMFQSAI